MILKEIKVVYVFLSVSVLFNRLDIGRMGIIQIKTLRIIKYREFWVRVKPRYIIESCFLFVTGTKPRLPGSAEHMIGVFVYNLSKATFTST